ncbi:hypothetical protein SDRG_03137 [Saprolegnia diclina VS20]|uniref:Uncharacterized protein n=1 Tax=Saprolegnia diclina (strain VS20) TaxID=1156394 RepID=T0QNM8_SAPDV|nr:hypothetical protein SDRG_03137 [Saprolegnia diclina VS20]EQC39709.1 hypothetical protein SDRG_03137 [Saprolegnia diclina VS20]|eukprot:XP_008606981.1 hypothetical protein SDRG_03137 [Saprolegnia diclina VS20]
MDRRETTVQANNEGTDVLAQRLNKRRRLGQLDTTNGTSNATDAVAALKAQLAEATTAAADTEARIVVLTNKCEFLSSKNAELRARLGPGHAGTATAEASATDARDDSSRSHIAALETKVKTLESQLQVAITTSNEYEKQHASVKATYSRLLSSVAQQQIALAASAGQLQEARTAAKASDDQVQTLTRANSDLQATITRLAADVAAATKASGQEKTTDDLRQTVRLLKENETGLRARVQLLEADLATAKEQLITVTASSGLWQKRAETQTKRAQELSNDKQCLASAMEQLKADLATAKAELVGSLASAASFAQWQQQAENAMAQVEDLMAEKTRLAQTVKQLVAAGKGSKQVDTLTTDKSRLVVDLADAKTQLNYALAAAKNAAQYQQQAKDCAQQVEDLSAEKGRLAAAVKQLVTSSNDIKKQLSASEAASAKWRQQAMTSSAKVDELSGKVDKLSAERDQLATEKDRLAADKGRLTIENEQLSTDKQQLATDKQQLIAEMDQLTADRERLAAMIKWLEADLTSSKAQVEELTVASANWQQKADDNSKEVETLIAGKARLESVLKWLEADLAAAKSAPGDARANKHEASPPTTTVGTLEGEGDAAQSGDAHWRQQLVVCEKRAEELMAEKNQVMDVVKQLKADLVFTKAQLEVATTAVEASKKQVRDLGASKGRLTTTIQQLSADLAKARAESHIVARAESHEKTQSHATLQAQIDALLDETRRQAAVIAQLEADLAAARRAPAPTADVATLQKQVQRFKDNKARLLETITQLEADRATIKGQLETALAAAGSSCNEAHAVTVEADRLRTELAALRDQMQLEAEVEAAAAAARKKELASLTAEVKQMRADLAAARLREYAAVKATILQTAASDENLQAATRRLEATIEELTAELTAAREELATATPASNVDTTAADLEAQRNDAQEDVASLRAQLAIAKRSTLETIRDFFRSVDSTFKFAGHGAVDALLDALYHADTSGAFEATDGIYIYAQRLLQPSGESAAAMYDAQLREIAATAPWLAMLPLRTPYLVPPHEHARGVVSDRLRRHIALVQQFWQDKSRDVWMSSFVLSLSPAVTMDLEDAVAEIVVDLVDLVTHNMVDRRIRHFLRYPHPSWPLVTRGIDALPVADAPAFLADEAAKLWPSCPGGAVHTPLDMTLRYLARHPSSDPTLSVGCASAVRSDVEAFCATVSTCPLVAMPMTLLAPCATSPSPGLELVGHERPLPTTHQWSAALEKAIPLFET